MWVSTSAQPIVFALTTFPVIVSNWVAAWDDGCDGICKANVCVDNQCGVKRDSVDCGTVDCQIKVNLPVIYYLDLKNSSKLL